MRSTKSTRVRFTSGPSQALRLLTFIFALIQLGTIGTLAAIALNDTSSPAFFRATGLLMNAIYAMLLVSVFVDQEMSDFWTALVAGIFTLLADVLILAYEIARWDESGTQIEYAIEQGYPKSVSIVPIISIVLTVFAFVSFIMLTVWMNQRREFLNFQRSIILNNSVATSDGRDNQIFMEMKRSKDRRDARMAASISDTKKTWSIVITIVGLLLLAGCAIVSFLAFHSAAFYRGYFLLFPAVLFGADLAFFGTTPGYWNWVTFFLALLSAGMCTWGSILELTRFFQCALASSAPHGALDTAICERDGFIGYILPWTLVALVILSIGQSILSILMATGKSIYSTSRQD